MVDITANDWFCCKLHSCKWPVAAGRVASGFTTSLAAKSLVALTASGLNLGGPYKLARCTLICCKCLYTGFLQFSVSEIIKQPIPNSIHKILRMSLWKIWSGYLKTILLKDKTSYRTKLNSYRINDHREGSEVTKTAINCQNRFIHNSFENFLNLASRFFKFKTSTSAKSEKKTLCRTRNLREICINGRPFCSRQCIIGIRIRYLIIFREKLIRNICLRQIIFSSLT